MYLSKNGVSLPINLRPFFASTLRATGSLWKPPITPDRALIVLSLAEHVARISEVSGLASQHGNTRAPLTFLEVAMSFRQHAASNIPASVAGAINVPSNLTDTPVNRMKFLTLLWTLLLLVL